MGESNSLGVDKGVKISFKDFIWIIMLISSMIGMYYTLSGRTDLLEKEVNDLNKEMHETNIKLLKHDIDYLKKRTDALEKDNREWHKKFD